MKASPSLIADVITVSEDGSTINAKGNVEVTYEKIKLNAEMISYDKLNDQIRATGPIIFYDGKQTLIFASDALFDKNFENAVLQSAKFVLSSSLEIFSEKVIRKDGISNNFYKTIASTCKVCKKRDTPLWEIRAKRIFHDEELKQIYFYNSQFRFWGIPIVYFPIMRLPDPTVKRAKGFLVPDISYSKSSNTKIKLPYFIPIDASSDVTFTPTINTNKSFSVGLDYRKLFRDSNLNVEAFGINNSTSGTSDGYLFTNFNSKLSNGRNIRLQYQRASNVDLMTDHTTKDIKFTESYFEFTQQNRYHYRYSGLYDSTLQNSAVTNKNMPNLYFKSNMDYFIHPKNIGGQASLSISADGYKRKSTQDGALGRDAMATRFDLSWHKESFTGFGGILGFKSLTLGKLSKYFDDSNIPNTIGQIAQIGGVEFSLPVISKSDSASTIYTPKIQLVYSLPRTSSEPNEASQHSEISFANFYDLNHSYGFDKIENGMHIQTGLETSHRSSNGYRADFFLGNINRINGKNSFSTGSGLEGDASNNLGALKLTFSEKLTLDADLITNNKFEITRNNLQLSYKERNLNLYSNFFYKSKNEDYGFPKERSELNLGAGYNLNKKTTADVSIVYDAKEKNTIRSQLSSRYKHDCITVDFYISRDFNSSSSLTPGISLGLKLELLGIGTKKTSSKANISNCTK